MYFNENLIIKQAYAQTRKLLRNKKLKKTFCAICGCKAEIHHCNYEDPSDVKFLCRKHHRQLHSTLTESPYQILNRTIKPKIDKKVLYVLDRQPAMDW